MARLKEFDPDVALEAAMELFWRRGYEAASTTDLLEAAGIARASLYGTFGSKHALYVRALDRYLERKDAAIIELLSQPGPAVPQVARLITLYTNPGPEPLIRGCLLVNSAVELVDRDTDVASRVRSSWDRIEAALTGALVRARIQGELSPDADPHALASLILVFLQGSRIFDKDPNSEVRLRRAGEHMISLLA